MNGQQGMSKWVAWAKNMEKGMGKKVCRGLIVFLTSLSSDKHQIFIGRSPFINCQIHVRLNLY